MSKKLNNNETVTVKVTERENKGGIRFYLDYSINGVRVREPIQTIALVKKGSREYKDSKLIAESVAANRMAELREGTYAGTKAKSALLLKDWVIQCAVKAELHATAGGSRNTWAKMLRQVCVLLQEYKVDTRLVEVDKAFVRGFIKFLQHDYIPPRCKGTYAPKTADKYYGCLRFVLNEAKREEIIVSNPCDHIASNEKIKVPESTRCYLTIEDLNRLYHTPLESIRSKNIFLFMCFTGLRINDALTLKWSDIEQDGEQWKIKKVTRKTKKVIYNPLCATARQFMPVRSSSDLVFHDWIPEQDINKSLKVWARRAKVDKNLTNHVARHTYATLLITKGVDIYTTSELLGHSNIATTKIYAKIVDSKKKAATETLDDVLKD